MPTTSSMRKHSSRAWCWLTKPVLPLALAPFDSAQGPKVSMTFAQAHSAGTACAHFGLTLCLPLQRRGRNQFNSGNIH